MLAICTQPSWLAPALSSGLSASCYGLLSVAGSLEQWCFVWRVKALYVQFGAGQLYHGAGETDGKWRRCGVNVHGLNLNDVTMVALVSEFHPSWNRCIGWRVSFWNLVHVYVQLGAQVLLEFFLRFGVRMMPPATHLVGPGCGILISHTHCVGTVSTFGTCSRIAKPPKEAMESFEG